MNKKPRSYYKICMFILDIVWRLIAMFLIILAFTFFLSFLAYCQK